MNGRKHIHRVAALLTAVAALAFFAGSVQAANSRPSGMTKAEYRAEMLRGEALNVWYGLGGAEMLRGEALNVAYGLGPAHVARSRAPVVRSRAPALTVAENGFVWSGFAIGAAAMLGLVLMATGVFAATRRIPRTRASS